MTMVEDLPAPAADPPRPLASRLSGWPVGVVVLVPLLYAFELTWQEYLRLGLITAGLAYLWWGRPSERISICLLAGALIFGLLQFDPAARSADSPVSALGAQVFPWLYAGPLLVAASLHLWSARPVSFRLTRPDWVVLAVGGLAAVAVGWQSWSRPEAGWAGVMKVAIAVLIWFLVVRAAGPRSGMVRALKIATVAVFAIVGAVGCGRIAAAAHHHAEAEKAQQAGDMGAALYYCRQAAELSGDLGLRGMEESATFRMAGILYRRGKLDAAAAALSLEKGFVQRVGPDEWEGPEKGNLYYLGSCWKDLPFYAGDLEIRIFARGKPALDVWPLMRVKLADQTLGDVFVASDQLEAYSFPVRVPNQSHKRLEVGFLNDYHQTDPPGDRNLWVEQAEIQYRSIVW